MLTNQALLLAASVITMYIVLGVLYESFIHPITILSTLPSAGIGAMLALILAGHDLDVLGIIGIILLIGIVKKNAIMMIDFALDAQRKGGLAPREAITQASLLRFRPILMTTMAALLGALPLMLSYGAGSELRRPLGHRDRGRLDRESAPHIVHDAGHLSGLRSSGGRAPPPLRCGPARGARGSDAGMNLSRIFIERPVATTLLTLGVALAGAFAYVHLPVSPLPQVDYPTISVSASLPGADPETVSTSVAEPLERYLGEIADVTEITSQSSTGQTRITLQFDLDRDINGAARDVQAAINAAAADVSTSLSSNPTYRKVNPADAPLMIIALTSKTLTRGQLYDAASNILQQRLSQLDGIGQVSIGGATLPAVRVELNPTAMFHYGIGLEDVRAALASANANSPKGAIEEGAHRFQLYTNDQASRASEYRPLVIAYRNGSAVQLADVADVEDSVQDLRNEGQANGQPSVLVILSRQPGANIIDTVDQVKAELPQLQAALPSDVNLTIVSDRSGTIRASLRDTKWTLLLAVGAGDVRGVSRLGRRARRARAGGGRAHLAHRHVQRHVSARLQPR